MTPAQELKQLLDSDSTDQAAIETALLAVEARKAEVAEELEVLMDLTEAAEMRLVDIEEMQE